MKRAATDNKMESIETEEEFLKGMKKLAVRLPNALVSQVNFLRMGLDRGKCQ